MEWTIDFAELENRIKHFYVGIGYTIPKIARGELWESRDCVEWYRQQALITFEDILAQRKREGYRRLERKLSTEKLRFLERTIPSKLTPMEFFRSLDKIFEYFDTFLRGRFIELGVFPTEDATRMMEFYQRKKTEILKNKI